MCGWNCCWTRKELKGLDVFQSMEAHLLSMSEFTLYSIGVILTRLAKDDLFVEFLSNTIVDSGMGRIRLETEDLKQLIAVRHQYSWISMTHINMLPRTSMICQS